MAARAGGYMDRSASISTPENTTVQTSAVPVVNAPPYFAPLNNGASGAQFVKKQSG